jgi:ketol-acid reductoisomerase
MLKEFMAGLDVDVIGKGMACEDNGVDNIRLIQVNDAIRNHPVEIVGKKLRGYMGAMKALR